MHEQKSRSRLNKNLRSTTHIGPSSTGRETADSANRNSISAPEVTDLLQDYTRIAEQQGLTDVPIVRIACLHPIERYGETEVSQSVSTDIENDIVVEAIIKTTSLAAATDATGKSTRSVSTGIKDGEANADNNRATLVTTGQSRHSSIVHNSQLQKRLSAIHNSYQRYRPCIEARVPKSKRREIQTIGQLDNNTVKSIHMRGWHCDSDHLRVLQQCGTTLSQLSSLTLSAVGADASLLPQLIAVLHSRPTIVHLNLDLNPGIVAVSAPLLSVPNLQYLSLRHCSACDGQLSELCTALKQLQSLPSTTASNVTSATPLATVFKSPPLRHLDLSNNRLTDDGARQFADTLCVNRSLKSLCLAHNSLSTHGAVWLASALLPFIHNPEHIQLVRTAEQLTGVPPDQSLPNRSDFNGNNEGHTDSKTSSPVNTGNQQNDTTKKQEIIAAGGRRGKQATNQISRLLSTATNDMFISDQLPTMIHPLTFGALEAVEASVAARANGCGDISGILETAAQTKDKKRLCAGNQALSSLSLAYNRRIGPVAVEIFTDVLHYQEQLPPSLMLQSGEGLRRLVLDGTAAAMSASMFNNERGDAYRRLETLLNQRHQVTSGIKTNTPTETAKHSSNVQKL